MATRMLASLALSVWLWAGAVAYAQSADETAKAIERDRYMVVVGACNVCHTANYVEREGNVPEKDWLMGNPIGWRGPWGTTYAGNLRLAPDIFGESQYVSFIRARRTKPPHPWYDMNKWSDEDLKALYQFLKMLGSAGPPMRGSLPSFVEPKPPYYNLVLPPAK
jgi:mono/diheme cytochrome c family protein